METEVKVKFNGVLIDNLQDENTCKKYGMQIIEIKNMQPGQTGIVLNIQHNQNTIPPSKGHIVMRSLRSDQFEVMDLSDFNKDSIWLSTCTLAVAILPKGSELEFRVKY